MLVAVGGVDDLTGYGLFWIALFLSLESQPKKFLWMCEWTAPHGSVEATILDWRATNMQKGYQWTVPLTKENWAIANAEFAVAGIGW